MPGVERPALRVCVAGITGRTGRAVAGAVEEAPDLELTAGVSRSDPAGFPSVAEALERLEGVRTPAPRVPLDEVLGAREARGATVAGTQVHPVGLPSFTASTEVVFAADDERLSVRHDAGRSAAPYVAGTLLAIRAVPGRVGLTRGLDQLLD